MAQEFCCFSIVTIIFVPIIGFILSHFFPELFILHIIGLSFFIYSIIYLILQKIFGRGEFDD